MLAARLNFIAQHNPAIQYSAKEIFRNMARPETAHFAKIKKLARFLLGVKTVEWVCPRQEEQKAVKMQVFSDSDWAGCLRTRRSTSGGLMMAGWHPLRTWSSTQKVVATSSAEAELYSAAEGALRGLGLQSMLREMEGRRKFGIVNRLFVRQGVRIYQRARTYAPSGGERLVAPGFGERESCLCRALCGRCLLPFGNDAQAALDLMWAARKESRQK